MVRRDGTIRLQTVRGASSVWSVGGACVWIERKRRGSFQKIMTEVPILDSR